VLRQTRYVKKNRWAGGKKETMKRVGEPHEKGEKLQDIEKFRKSRLGNRGKGNCSQPVSKG